MTIISKTEKVCSYSAALISGTVTGHIVGKTLNGFLIVEVVPLVVHALQGYILPYVANTSFGSGFATASTYYLTGLITPYILMGTQLVGGYIGAQAGYWAAKSVIVLTRKILLYVARMANWLYQSLFGNIKAEPKTPKVTDEIKIKSSKELIETKRRPFEFEDLEALKKMGYFDLKV